MVIHPVCGTTRALSRLNANHMGQQVGSLHVWSEHTHAQIQRVRKRNGTKHQILLWGGGEVSSVVDDI